ncbi:efflux RND transporter permease subunit [Vibrio aestuarianus]|uniref:Multidrug transporter AcrB n=1 Tax=Vibrio aestuarianus TaxID=28171 RepID=A0ABN8TKB1_9VIBR|nr:efflux RND transporter permease subunit [Vibrio aestuarianus]MDE1214501.1 efflux RND transporter permease subunit [Vibrio aestuarianus]MDE1219271.1 efflux RND transporter permease subunit [Vibrio aestuarianus]MDE1229452.1 efflux RND transporter permease subunit [Vibrio aestuarianus]MDE1258695.1 efflux RND transporter permease subunit [Vibrio aestuarianus]MDE1261523.1 efflux RND transporter permease subunit [Vibrio aestuarianus]
MDNRLGISGRIAKAFQNSAMTPLLALVGLLMGVFAVMVTPKEEEPQIDVTFADVYIPFPGASPAEVESLVTNPAEQIISEIQGIDKIYSFSQPDGAMIVAIFEVGVPRNEAVVRIYNKLYSNKDWMPASVGVGEPIIKPKGIEDVPIVSITLSDKSGLYDSQQLTQVAHGLETELKRIDGTRDIYTVGRQPTIVDVRLDPVKMNSFGITLDQLNQHLPAANASSTMLKLTHDNQQFPIQVGQFLTRVEEVKQLVVGLHNNTPVYLSDVATVNLGVDTPTQHVWTSDKQGIYPAVTLAIAKKGGENAVRVAQVVEARVAELENQLIPKGISVEITRDYGQTAADKSNTLIAKLIFATTAVVILVVLAMGWREAIVVGIAIIVTLMITLFASWAWGFTLNRVSLFALIFSIGILVDDAIVVVENIHRHMALGKNKLSELIPVAVDEVGGPTILATLTVIAALLPMAFVSGLMGPYMSPIPINASMGMLISLAVAFVLSPWLAGKFLKSAPHHPEGKAASGIFHRIMNPFVTSSSQRRNRWLLLLGVFALITGSILLPVTKAVILKMLPFDNKSEFQVVLDMPEGASLEKTQRVLFELGAVLNNVPEVSGYQIYAGTAAPINFNGLVRHYFMRNQANQGDIQVNLLGRKERDKDSHSIASEVRPLLNEVAQRFGGKVKVVEVPPGPPVWSPILAEVYGPTPEIRAQAARQLRDIFRSTPDIVDVDMYLPEIHQKWQVVIDRSKASHYQVPYASIVDALATAVGGKPVTYLHSEHSKYPIPVQIQATETAKVRLEQVLNMKVGSLTGSAYPLSDLVEVRQTQMDDYIVHKNLLPMVMVVADMTGEIDSPLYGMFEMALNMDELGLPVEQYYIHQPTGLNGVEIFWDGEWTITYETFRDMGIAYGVGMILIYLLVVAQFKSYLVPLIIMAPIPLTIIGVMPGHAILGAQFTATSMIGMIALAGIIVRNSILLVDFINQQVEAGMEFSEAVIQSAAVRAKPIMLTALAAMIGAVFILDDPIFNGLAISLIFGIFVSTVLTLLVIPVLYYVVMKKRFCHH